MKPLALRPRRQSESGAIYTAASPGRLQAGLSHQMGGGGGDVEGEGEQKNNKVMETSANQEAPISWKSRWFALPALCKTATGAWIQKVTKTNRRGGGGGVPQEGVQHDSVIFIHTNRNHSAPVGGTWFVCGPGVHVALARTSRCFLLSHSPDVTLPVTQFAVSHFTHIQEGRSKAG